MRWRVEATSQRRRCHLAVGLEPGRPRARDGSRPPAPGPPVGRGRGNRMRRIHDPPTPRAAGFGAASRTGGYRDPPERGPSAAALALRPAFEDMDDRLATRRLADYLDLRSRRRARATQPVDAHPVQCLSTPHGQPSVAIPRRCPPLPHALAVATAHGSRYGHETRFGLQLGHRRRPSVRWRMQAVVLNPRTSIPDDATPASMGAGGKRCRSDAIWTGWDCPIPSSRCCAGIGQPDIQRVVRRATGSPRDQFP